VNAVPAATPQKRLAQFLANDSREILMDMSMPKLNGVEATRIIHKDWPEIRVIGLSMFEEAERAQAMRDAGAVDYITKSGPAEAMIDVIRSSVRASNKALSATTPS
jgi:DNA-binding NarL/FixJ family response regulator